MSRLDRRDALAFSLLLVPYLWLVQRYWFVCDDAFITFRYSRNLAQGLGPRYNVARELPVEGYSDFLWMLIAAVFEKLQMEPRVWMPVVSLGIGLGVLAALYTFLRRAMGVGLVATFAATLFVATFPPFAVWSTSGLETMAEVGLMFFTFTLLTTRDDDLGTALAGVTALGLALVRTEGIAWAAVLGVLSAGARWYDGRPVRRPLLQYGAVILVPFSLYYAWRFSYYRSWVANTALAKVHMEPITLLRGLMYVALYVLTLLTPAALAWSLPAALRSERRSVAAFAGLMAIGVPAYAVTVSGDYMAWFRILVPGVPFLAVVLGLAWKGWEQAADGPRRVGLMALVLCALNLLPSVDLHLVPEPVRDAVAVREKLGFFRTENQQWEAMNDHVATWTEKGLALQQATEKGDTYVAAAIGAVGYYSNLYIYDRNGLVNREVAMQPWSGELRSPGHDKVVDRSFFFDKKPDILDSEVLGGNRLRGQIKSSLKEMEAADVRERYYPEMVEVDTPHPVGPKPRYLLLLRRAASIEESQVRWEQFEATWLIKKGNGSDGSAEDEEAVDEP